MDILRAIMRIMAHEGAVISDYSYRGKFGVCNSNMHLFFLVYILIAFIENQMCFAELDQVDNR